MPRTMSIAYGTVNCQTSSTTSTARKLKAARFRHAFGTRVSTKTSARNRNKKVILFLLFRKYNCVTLSALETENVHVHGEFRSEDRTWKRGQEMRNIEQAKQIRGKQVFIDRVRSNTPSSATSRVTIEIGTRNRTSIIYICYISFVCAKDSLYIFYRRYLLSLSLSLLIGTTMHLSREFGQPKLRKENTEKRATRYTTSARGYSLADEVLEHGAFARALAAHHRDLRQIELHMHAELRERILQFVHDRDQLFHTRVARHPAAGVA